MDLYFLQNFWYVLIAVAFTVFLLLDGFDLGIGMLFPFFSKDEKEQQAVLDVIWPVWDGNELWGLIGGGAVLAIFPTAFATALPLLYPAVFLLMVFLIFRPITFELWYHDLKMRRTWEWMFFATSLALAFVFGAVLGAAVTGLPLAGDGKFTKALAVLATPLPIFTGLAVAAGALAHGAAYLARKTDGVIRARALVLANRIAPAALAAFVVFALAALTTKGAGREPIGVLIAVLGAGSLAMAWRAVRGGATGPVFQWTGGGLVAILALLAALHYPNVLTDSSAANASITIRDSSPQYSLQFLAIAGSIALTATTAYTIFVYRVLRRKGPSSH